MDTLTLSEKLLEFSEHKDGCRRVDYFMGSRYYDSTVKCTCGLAALEDALKTLGVETIPQRSNGVQGPPV